MKALTLVLAALAAGCALATEAGPPAMGEDFRVRLGEEVALEGGRLTVGFEEVPSDSRCPADVQCVHAGEAVVVLAVSAPGREAGTVTLRTTQGKRTAAYGAFRIELRALDPAPRQGGTVPETPYATLRVTGG